MVDSDQFLEEKLREACSVGDIEAVEILISKGINVNSKNEINGWTPLHWAAHRGYQDIVQLLLRNGADKWKVTHKGEAPHSLAKNKDLQILLGGIPTEVSQDLPITPNYLKYSTLLDRGDLGMKNSCNNLDELVLKVRIANCGDPDFIEIEMQKNELTFAKLIKICCEELNTSPNQISKIRKLPNTVIRKDKDVQRLVDYQEIELVLSTQNTSNTGVLLPTPISPTINGNGYESIYLRKNQTILY